MYKNVIRCVLAMCAAFSIAKASAVNSVVQFSSIAAEQEAEDSAIRLGACNLSCAQCVIGQRCPNDPETGKSQRCVPACP